MKLPRWIRDLDWRVVAGALLLGGILHIGATLAVTALGPGNGFQRVRETLPVNRMVVLPPVAPGKEPLPFMVPDALYAMCRYSISDDPVAVSAALAEAGWTLSLHTPQGDNFYVMPATQLRRPEVSFVLVPGGDRYSDHAPAPRRVNAPGAQIPSPSLEGLVVVRAPLRGLAWRAEAEAQLRRASCATVKR
jgi:uncharacterized membrane protein